MDDSDEPPVGQPDFKNRLKGFLNKVEELYLGILRAVVLLCATLLLGFALWMTITSIYKLSLSVESVQEVAATVSADEITGAEMPNRREHEGLESANSPDPAHHEYYSSFVKRYHSLFSTHFEPFRQAEDKKLTEAEFDDAFLNTSARLEAVTTGKISFDADKQELETLLVVMTEAASKSQTQTRLKQYQSAKKVPVSTKVQRTRTVQRQGWNPQSTDCPNWYEPPYGCSETRTVQVPYTETVTNMEFPPGTQSHSQIFRAFQDRFIALHREKKIASAQQAESERQSILRANADGRASLLSAIYVIGGFLVLMFFFLLIAIERHQRSVAASERAAGAAFKVSDI